MQASFVAPTGRRGFVRWLVGLSALSLVVGMAASNADAAGKKTSGPAVKFQVTSFVNSLAGSAPSVYAGARAAARSVNKAGGINGRPVQIVTCNMKATAAGSTDCARQAIDQKVVANLGVDPFAPLVYPILGKENVPSWLINPSATSFQTPTEFPLTGGGFMWYMGGAAAAKKAGVKKLGIICLDFPGLDVVCENIKRVAAKQGYKDVVVVKTSPTTTTFGSQMQQLKSAGVDGVMPMYFPGTESALISATESINFKPRWILFGAPGPKGSGIPNAFAKFTYWTVNDLPPISAASRYPGLRTFKKEMVAAGKAGIKDTAPKNYDNYAISLWLGVHGFSKVAAKVKGPVTKEKLLAQLNKTRSVNVEGLVNWAPKKTGSKPYPALTGGARRVYVGPVVKGVFTPNPRSPISPITGVQLK